MPGLEVRFFIGPDMTGTKVVSGRDLTGLDVRVVKTAHLPFATINSEGLIPFPVGLWGALREYRPDVVVCEGASHIVANCIAFVFCRAHRIPIIQWGLGELKGRQRSWQRRIVDIVFQRLEGSSDAAIAYSSFGAHYYRRVGVHPKRVITAVNVVDTDQRWLELREFAEARALPVPSPVPEVFRIVFVGTITQAKRVDLLLTAFGDLLKRVPAAELTVVGGGDQLSAMRDLARRLNIQDNIEFTGPQHGSLARFFYAASVCVMPGLGGLVVSEALSHGVPVIAALGDGSESDLINGKNGQVLSCVTSEILSSTLAELAMDRRRQEEWRANSRAVIEARYNTSSYVNAIAECIETACHAD